MKMKAAFYTEYGPPEVLNLQEVPKPTPQDNDILVRVRATTVNYGDISARNFKAMTPREFNMPLPLLLPVRMMFGFNKPRRGILGSEFAGNVEAVGKGVTRFKRGDPVFGYVGQRMGAYAEYLCVPEDGTVAPKPANMSYEEAATVPYGGIMALSLLRKADVQPGQKVLVNGASGGIGSAAVQLATAHFGADVTGVCSTPRLAYVESLGASRAIDYTQEDFTQSGETYDLIFDILGKRSYPQVKDALTQNGRYLLASFKTRHLLQMLRTSLGSSKKVICAMASESAEDLSFLKALVEAGKIKAIIDKHYPLEQAAEAHRYVAEGRKQGHVVITVT
jgi:NADPH:quinone reductase-like Zn-dependent oxidoreductase